MPNLRPLSRFVLVLLLVSCVGACSTLPAREPSTPEHALTGYEQTPLAVMLRKVLPTDGRSGFLLQPYGPNAFATRLELTKLATRSLDIQYYLLANDNTGRSLMRALRDAAMRGVHVRVLLDDLYTAGEDKLLLGLASYPNVEVRLFNPFPGGRSGNIARFIASGFDYSRVNRRMHNKLFVADNSAAVFGGRNMADEYVQNANGRSFIDMDTFAAGPVVRDLSIQFDNYWNSEVVHPLERITHSDLSANQLQQDFELRTVSATSPEIGEIPMDGIPLHPAPGEPDSVDSELIPMLNLPFGLGRRQVGPLLWAGARVLADSPLKAEGLNEKAKTLDGTVTKGIIDWFQSSTESIAMVSPYFVPNDAAVNSLVDARRAGIRVRLVTNSLASTDEPWAYVGYSAYLRRLIAAGVEVEEISPLLAVKRRRLGIFGTRTAALHMKSAIVDGRQVFLGSMNLDQRSARLNTELAVIIDSSEMARQLSALSDNGSAYSVRPSTATGGIEWVEKDDDGPDIVYSVPPETTAWQRFWLRVQAPFIPEREL